MEFFILWNSELLLLIISFSSIFYVRLSFLFIIIIIIIIIIITITITIIIILFPTLK